MKKPVKRLLAAALVLCLLATGAYALTSENSLVTLSYLTETFMPAALKKGNAAGNKKLQQSYDNQKTALDGVQKDLLSATGKESDLLESAVLAPSTWTEGEYAILPTGSGFLLQSGNARMTHSGVVIDVSAGSEVSSGSYLKPDHRYLVGEDTSARVDILSGAASFAVQGSYSREGGEKSPLPFYDVSRGDWFYEPVSFVYGHGLFSGISEHEFGPFVPMNRAMVMTVLFQMAGAPQAEMDVADVSFSDVPENAWYAPYIKWAASQGITGGTSDTTFSPELQVTREQLAVLLYSFSSGYQGKEQTQRADLSSYQDLDKVSPWAVDSVSWAVSSGIINSTSSNTLTISPQKNASRAEVATMLRAFSQIS